MKRLLILFLLSAIIPLAAPSIAQRLPTLEERATAIRENPRIQERLRSGQHYGEAIGYISSPDGYMNCRKSPGGEVLLRLDDGESIGLVSAEVTDVGMWWLVDYGCYVHRSGVLTRTQIRN